MPYAKKKAKPPVRRRARPAQPAGAKVVAPSSGAPERPVVRIATPGEIREAHRLGDHFRELSLHRRGISDCQLEEERADRQFDAINSEYNRILAFLYPEQGYARARDLRKAEDDAGNEVP